MASAPCSAMMARQRVEISARASSQEMGAKPGSVPIPRFGLVLRRGVVTLTSGGDSLHPRVPLGAGLPFVVRVLRVAEDLVDVSVCGAVSENAAAVEADDAGRAHPALVCACDLSRFVLQAADHESSRFLRWMSL